MSAGCVMDTATTQDGHELVLYARAGVFQIRFDGFELATSRGHASEEELARRACGMLAGVHAPRVLVGGLGLGFTLRAALDVLDADATVTVAEVIPAVVAWNRGPVAHLARFPLADERVAVAERDVAEVLATSTTPFHALLLDVDNGPSRLTFPTNRRLYDEEGAALMHHCLVPGGVLAIWSAEPAPDVADRLARSGFDIDVESVQARGAAGAPPHTLLLATRHAGLIAPEKAAGLLAYGEE